jgi:hypothetical protein
MTPATSACSPPETALKTSDSKHVSWADGLKGSAQLRDVSPQVLKSVAPTEHDNRNSKGAEVLLELETSIGGDKHGESPIGCGSKEDPISQAEPALSADGGYLVIREFEREPARKRLVNENSHRSQRPLWPLPKPRLPVRDSPMETPKETH